jgi:hypothetical protein
MLQEIGLHLRLVGHLVWEVGSFQQPAGHIHQEVGRKDHFYFLMLRMEKSTFGGKNNFWQQCKPYFCVHGKIANFTRSMLTSFSCAVWHGIWAPKTRLLF